MAMMVALMTMMRGMTATFAAKFVMQAARNVVLAMSAFMGFSEDIFVAEFPTSTTTMLVMMLLG